MANKYLNSYLKFLRGKADIKKPLKIVMDCSNGPAGLVLEKLKIPNSKFYILNSKIDGRFPAHGANPLERGGMDQAAEEVLRQKADLGVVFDADADRALFIDNKARKLPSYVIAFLFSLAHQPPFVADVYVFKSLEYAGLLNGKTYPSKVGTFNIKKEMGRRKASVGSEYSGHFYFKDFFSADSGILAAIKTLNILSQLPYSLADFYDLLPEFYSEQFNVRVKNVPKTMKKVKTAYGRRSLKTSRLDGLSFDFREWFLIVRPSNTEPVVRFFVASRNKPVFKKEIKKIKSLI